MTKEPLHILIVEDNPGDVLLIQENLSMEFDRATTVVAGSLAQFKKIIDENQHEFDVILLDLSLPDADGEDLVREVLERVNDAPVIVLTGLSSKSFSLKSLGLGLADYLMKSELSPYQLRKSIEYGMERSRFTVQISESEKKYRQIFHLSPLPMWVYDLKTLEFLDVNEAAVSNYGYSEKEFLSMTVKDIRPEEDIPVLEAALELSRDKDRHFYQAVVNHRRKDGTDMIVEVQSNIIDFDGKKAELVLANDITEKIETERELIFSEQRFKALVQNGADLISILDSRHDYRYISPTSNAILNKAPIHFLNKSFFDFIHKEDVALVRQAFAKLDNEYRVELVPYRMQDNNKKWRWITTTLTDMSDDPVIQGVVANSRDVTESVNAERKIEESNERYNIVAQATSDVIWDWDMQTDKIIWNAGLEKVFGYARDSIGDDVAWRDERIHPEDRKRMASRLLKFVKDGAVNWREEYRFMAADGNYRYVNDRGFVLYDNTGWAVRIIGAMQDISRQKHEAEEREKLLGELTRHNNDLRQFSYITSHNLRSPLSNIVGLLELINQYTFEEEKLAELIEGLSVSTEKLQETIDDLGKIISIKNSPSVQVEEIDLESITRSTLRQIDLNQITPAPKIDIDYSAAKSVFFNRTYLESILLNLMTNALKYRHPERGLELQIKSRVAKDSVEIVFSDNGLGLDVERYKDRLFGLYQRFHHNPDGKGIGLFLVKSQMEALGGSIGIESSVEEGTVFTLKFKRTKDD